jgi:Rod binding domain-containing protein
MEVTGIDNANVSAASDRVARPTADEFEKRMEAAAAAAAQGADLAGLDPERADTLREASRELVSITFVQPMLAKMREDPFKTDLFHGGRTEEIFGQRLDAVLSERITSRADFSIVDAVYRQLERNAMNEAARAQGVDTDA